MNRMDCLFKSDTIARDNNEINVIISSSIPRLDELHIYLRKRLEHDLNVRYNFIKHIFHPILTH